MESDDPKPENKPAGNMPPPRPPRGTVIGLGPESDGADKNRRVTITKIAHGESKFTHQLNGRMHYAHLKVKVEPNEKGKGNKIVSEVNDSVIPANYMQSAANGVHEALNCGMVVGHTAVDERRVIDVVVRIVDGSFHKTDSNELAFKMAGIFAIKDAIKHAGPIVIE